MNNFNIKIRTFAESIAYISFDTKASCHFNALLNTIQTRDGCDGNRKQCSNETFSGFKGVVLRFSPRGMIFCTRCNTSRLLKLNSEV